jgi:hypothetical protein
MNIYSTISALLLGLLFALQALAEASPEAALDTLHRAGAEANQADFIGVLAQGVVFLGVGDGTRLQGQALRDFVSESFASGNTWDYRTSERDVRLSADGSVAWFDESLEHDQLGRGRGSGVLTQNEGAWKIAQYDLTVPLPGAVEVSEAETPGAAAPAMSKTPQKPRCRKIRHKTNKQASC